MDLFFQIILLFSLILLNGFFVASELTLIALRKTRVDELMQKGNPMARFLSDALNHLEIYISATQLGITIVSLLLGWIGAQTIAARIADMINIFPKSGAFVYVHTIALTISFLLVTYIQIVLGELVPKALAIQKTEFLSMVLIFPLTLFTRIFSPFIKLLNTSSNFVLHLLHMDSSMHPHIPYTTDEIHMILDQFRQSGILPKDEVEMVQNAFKLQDIPIKQIMIPRLDIIAFEESCTCASVLKKLEKFNHSRFPVYRRTLDNIVGFVHVKDVYQALLRGENEKKLSQTRIIRKIILVPETRKADDVLLDMRKKHIHLGVVDDEYGQTAGIVSLEDIIESLVGEIQDEFDKPIKEIKRQIDGSFLIDGRASLETIQKRFLLSIKGLGYSTIGGLVFGLLGHEPKVTDSVQIGNIVLIVEQIDGKRVQTVRLRRETVKA